jgi:hypothetical protein
VRALRHLGRSPRREPQVGCASTSVSLGRRSSSSAVHEATRAGQRHPARVAFTRRPSASPATWSSSISESTAAKALMGVDPLHPTTVGWFHRVVPVVPQITSTAQASAGATIRMVKEQLRGPRPQQDHSRAHPLPALGTTVLRARGPPASRVSLQLPRTLDRARGRRAVPRARESDGHAARALTSSTSTSGVAKGQH